MNYIIMYKNIKRAIVSSVILGTLLTLLMVFTSINNAFGQSDPRVSAEDHPLASAIGRLRTNGTGPTNHRVCTAWIAQGGVLITAGHCNIIGDILEFNLPEYSESCGQLIPADEKDQYVINNVIASSNSGEGNDWKIFEVEDNPITGYQPIEAQLKYIHLSSLRCSAPQCPMEAPLQTKPNLSSYKSSKYRYDYLNFFTLFCNKYPPPILL